MALFFTEMKQSWKERAISFKLRFIKEEFEVLPTELGQGVADLERVLRHELKCDWKHIVKQMSYTLQTIQKNYLRKCTELARKE